MLQSDQSDVEQHHDVNASASQFVDLGTLTVSYCIVIQFIRSLPIKAMPYSFVLGPKLAIFRSELSGKECYQQAVLGVICTVTERQSSVKMLPVRAHTSVRTRRCANLFAAFVFIKRCIFKSL